MNIHTYVLYQNGVPVAGADDWESMIHYIGQYAQDGTVIVEYTDTGQQAFIGQMDYASAVHAAGLARECMDHADTIREMLRPIAEIVVEMHEEEEP